MLGLLGWGVGAVFVFALTLVGFESSLVYHPMRHPVGNWNPQSYGLQSEEVSFSAPGGPQLHGWFFPVPEAKATLLWFHGNAGNITHRLDNIQKLQALRLNIFIFDYRGYGKSEGKPDEMGLYADSQAAYDYLVKVRNIVPEWLILFGRSLGAACAVETALHNPAAGLIVESGFTSASDMAREMFPLFSLGWAIQSKMNSLEKIPRLTLPKLIAHGSQDEIVPFSMGQRLYSAAKEPKEFYAIEGAGHNDTYFVNTGEYLRQWDRFIVGALAAAKKL
ncbi:MAG: alpha/beta hydrolase [Candidatus Nitrohelix vancouverensis]|uniref:Alpha/beta hydrolase n=1 Tax=Candidatus Nitrohelix vancouverensis TaxID=2705534 RepID=A0A7T0C4R0_9BACT|nr:MAG: alpha/beta hydrolase [Candidatus Nitrohelix vancouverensis]